MAAYCATKAAVTQWTKILAEDTKGHGISVFAFHPGAVRTPMLAALTESADVPTEVGDRFRALLNQGRDTPIERCAQMLLFLVSGRADALLDRRARNSMSFRTHAEREVVHSLVVRPLRAASARTGLDRRHAVVPWR
jgi:NAD(P)-dependent dehydrogenase (short-subunit alcohol dehydrogenase family)